MVEHHENDEVGTELEYSLSSFGNICTWISIRMSESLYASKWVCAVHEWKLAGLNMTTCMWIYGCVDVCGCVWRCGYGKVCIVEAGQINAVRAHWAMCPPTITRVCGDIIFIIATDRSEDDVIICSSVTTMYRVQIRNLKWPAIFPILHEFDWPCVESEFTMLKFWLAILEKWWKFASGQLLFCTLTYQRMW